MYGCACWLALAMHGCARLAVVATHTDALQSIAYLTQPLCTALQSVAYLTQPLCTALQSIAYLTQPLCTALQSVAYLTQPLCTALQSIAYLTQPLCTALQSIAYLTQPLCTALQSIAYPINPDVAATMKVNSGKCRVPEDQLNRGPKSSGPRMPARPLTACNAPCVSPCRHVYSQCVFFRGGVGSGRGSDTEKFQDMFHTSPMDITHQQRMGIISQQQRGRQGIVILSEVSRSGGGTCPL